MANCRYRVWDNGDKIDCGEACLVGFAYCPRHVARKKGSALLAYEKAVKDMGLAYEEAMQYGATRDDIEAARDRGRSAVKKAKAH